MAALVQGSGHTLARLDQLAGSVETDYSHSMSGSSTFIETTPHAPNINN